MKNKISALIIDKHKGEHDYNQIYMHEAPEWFEATYDITVIDDTKNILSEINKNKGIDSIITIGDEIDCEPLNQLSFEFRKKWGHIDHFDPSVIENMILNTFIGNINRSREDQKLFSIFTSTYNTPIKFF